eukprot:9199328-Pyramimonas_sp.AAC.1
MPKSPLWKWGIRRSSFALAGSVVPTLSGFSSPPSGTWSCSRGVKAVGAGAGHSPGKARVVRTGTSSGRSLIQSLNSTSAGIGWRSFVVQQQVHSQGRPLPW